MAKILIIDDKQDNLIAISALLKNIIPGCTVINAPSGVEGLKRAKTESPDTIILDIRMPDMDGYEVCIKLKQDQDTKHIPILMLTAVHRDVKSRIRGLEIGADAFLTKPVDEAELAAQVKVMLRIKKAEDRLRKEKDLLEDMVKERTRQLSESENRYRMLLRSANDAIFVIDLRPVSDTATECCSVGRFIEVNDIACQMSGYRRDELLRLYPVDIIDPEKRSDFAAIEKKLLADDYVLFETMYIDKEGNKIPVEISGHMFDLQEQSTVIYIARDITRRKEAEKEKEKIQSQLFQAQKMEAIGLLAGGIAHDFNNIMTVIKGFTNMAMSKIDQADPLYKRLELIDSAADKATNLTRQLLVFSRKQPMKPTPVNLNRTVDTLLQMISRIIGGRIKISTDLEPDLWDILADEGNIEQVIMNLVVNSRDAMPHGGKITIKTENLCLEELPVRDIPGARSGRFVCLSVADTGSGIDKKIIQQIFEPFFTTKEPEKGTGLGLSVVYGIVKHHQGNITVDSEPEQGTTFRIYLPAGCFR